MLVPSRTTIASRRIFRSVVGEDGFTLIEVLVAMVILVVGLLALTSMLDTSVKATMTTRAREGATNLAREIIEDARTIPYAQIVPTSIEGQLQAIKAEGEYPLADSSAASGWQIERRGFVYTVKVKECAIDDPKDGLAKEHGSTFCEGQTNGTGENEDTEPEDLKRITAEVTWTIQSHISSEAQVSMLTAAGQAIGLVAKELQLVEPPLSYNAIPTSPVITDQDRQTLTFSVSFPEGTSAIDWSLEGAKQEELAVSSSATSTTFSWTITGVSDGTYQVSAQALNSTGVIGPPISIPVRLIRGTPAAPSPIAGGFNTVYSSGTPTKVAELQWKADSERDVIGYRVHGPSAELVCPESIETLSTTTSCIDFKPSAGEYSVAALYRNRTEEVEEGSQGKVTINSSEAPKLPTGLILTKNADGSVTLNWTAPTAGAEVSFYRIYRGSTNYTSRYGETAETEFTDTEATTTHEYWVTAVSPTLTESEFLGPVTG